LTDAAACRGAGRMAEAAALLQQAAALAPDNAAIQHDLGQTQMILGQREAALARFDRAVMLDPAMGLAHFRRGVVLELLGRAGFIEAYRRAIETTPELAQAYGCLASAQEQAGLRREALQLYHQAAERSPAGSTARLLYTARAAMIEEDLDTAEGALRAVLAQEPRFGNARGMLANLLNARGRFQEAAAELETALRDNPRDVSLYYNIVQLRRLTMADVPLIERIRAARDMTAPVPARIRVHIALAKALDDVGAYDEAMDALDQASALRAGAHRLDRAAVTALTDRMIALFTPNRLARGARGASPSDRPILVLGMPRSGTTLTEQILSSHPDVAGAGEVKYWDGLGQQLLERFEAGDDDVAQVAAAYLAKLQAAAPDARHVVDKNPFNFRWALLIHLALPQVRIIHCRRHPADTALSIMMAALWPHRLFSAARDDLLFCFQDYLRLMAHLRAVLPTNRFHELHYEELVNQPEAQTRALVAFCGLPWNDACLAPEQNARVVRTASVWQARQKVFTGSAGRWRRYGTRIQAFAALAGDGEKDVTQGALPLDPVVRSTLSRDGA
jgi:tetratricopeptide (TPR) repeat protein